MNYLEIHILDQSQTFFLMSRNIFDNNLVSNLRSDFEYFG